VQEDARTQASRRGAIGWYNRILDSLAALLMGAIVVIMVVQVFARYVLNDSLIWAEELCRYLLIWITFLFIGIAFQRGEFIAIDVLPQALTPRWRFVLKLLVTIPVLIFLWLMVTNGYAHATRFSAQTIPAIDFIWSSLTGARANVPIVWVYISVPIGSALLILHMIVSLVFDARDVFAKSREAAPAPDGA
jgi:TRAP-type C4-dicarboxylate transport system permease small subunit